MSRPVETSPALNPVARALLDAFPSPCALLGPHGTLEACNGHWQDVFPDHDSPEGVSEGSVVQSSNGVCYNVKVTHMDLEGVSHRLLVLQAAPSEKPTPSVALSTLQGLLQHVPIGVALLDTDLRFQAINPALAEINATPLEAHLGKTISDLYPQGAERVEGYFRRVLETGEAILNREVHSRSFEDDFSKYIWLCNYYPVRDLDGKLLGVGCTVQDITEMKRSETQFRESQHFLQRISDTMPTVMYLQHLKERQVLFVNRHITETLGYNQQEIQEMDLAAQSHLAHPDELQMLTEHQKRLLQLKDGETLDREYRVKHKDGSWRWLYSRQTVFTRDEQGQPLTVLTGAVDITERKLAEQAFMESDYRFQRIADRAPVMIWMSGLQQETTFVNQVWQDYTGRSLEQDLGYGWFELVHPEDLQHCEVVCKGAYAQQQDFELEFRMKRHDGQYRWVVNRGIRRYTPDGAFQGFIGACIDIHDRKMAESALAESEQRLRELMQTQKRFVADAAHELRNPLTAVQGNMDLLVRYPNIPEDEKQEIIRDVQKEASRLGRLVHDMLQLARGDSGAALHEDELELHEVLKEAFRDIERLNVHHTLRLGEMQPLALVGDMDRLKQLAIILLENALKYTPAGGDIELSLGQQGDHAVIRVKDSGIGIHEEDLERVFERFYRVDKARHRGEDPGGTGLGLPIARWIVDGHGGRVWLESEPGKGTVAVVELPLKED